MTIQNFCRATLVALGLFAVSAASHAEWSIGVSVGFPPPALPVYEQPPIPAAGYLWTPGYWAFSAEDEDYYWVPGTWVLAPRPGYLWTPGYWAADGAYFGWHTGYWGPEVGFYGGINYGFGYFGIGFGGGYWRGDDFCYNRAVTNVNNVSITNVYNNTTIVNNQVTNSRVSYNGGQNGIRLRPSGADHAVAQIPHLGATNEQLRHESAARSIPALRAAANHGQPPIAATPKPAMFADLGRAAGGPRDVSAARGTPHAAGDRAGHGANLAQAGARPYRPTSPAASNSARPAASQPRQASNAPRTDRPAWADRGGAQTARRSPTMPSVVEHGAGQYHPGPSHGYSPGVRADYPAARAPAQRWTPPTHSAPEYRYVQREPPHPVTAQRMAAPPREFRSAPSYNPPHPAANVAPPREFRSAPSYNPPHPAANAAPPRTVNAPHGGGDGTRHGPNHP